MEPATFQLYKLSGVAGAFAISSLLQWVMPYRGRWRDVIRNWRTNLSLGLVGAVLMGTVCGGCVCGLAEKMRAAELGLFYWLDVPFSLRILITLLVLDFTAYAWHRANHRFSLLWRFHAVHHSDGVFESSTAVRFHPGEILISLGVRLLVVAAFGVPVLGVLMFEIVYAFFNFFEHGDIRLSDGVERRWAVVFISPALHRKHHSMKEHELNTNFGAIFSFWDRLFVTFRGATSQEEIHVGLPGVSGTTGVFSLLALPGNKKVA